MKHSYIPDLVFPWPARPRTISDREACTCACIPPVTRTPAPHCPGHHHGLGRRAGPSLAEAKAFSFPLLPPLPVRFTNSSPGFRGFLPLGWLHRPQVPSGPRGWIFKLVSLPAQQSPVVKTPPCLWGQDAFENLTEAVSHLHENHACPPRAQYPRRSVDSGNPPFAYAPVPKSGWPLGLIFVFSKCLRRAYYVPGTV